MSLRTLGSVDNPDTRPGDLTMARTFYPTHDLNLFTLADGMIVVTNLPTADEAQRCRGERELMEEYGDEYFGASWPSAGPMLELWYVGAVPGSTADLILRYGDDDVTDPEWALFLAECNRNAELAWTDDDAIEAETYARLERPRKRRQASLPDHHIKRWGHGNARELINRVGQFAHMRTA